MRSGPGSLLCTGAVAVALVTSCGAGDPRPAGLASTTIPVAPPATTLVTRSPNPPLPVRGDEPCPASTGGPVDPMSMEELPMLERMLGYVSQYGQQHPAEFGGYGLIWVGDDDAIVFASFAGELDAHRAALEQIVEDPGQLIVCHMQPPAPAEPQTTYAT
jgi:hypothetical protein